jgi:hypothetical protein
MLSNLRQQGGEPAERTVVMSWLQKVLRREGDHDKWLAAHPGKEATKSAPPERSAEEEARVRATMEAEMESSRSKRQQG